MAVNRLRSGFHVVDSSLDFIFRHGLEFAMLMCSVCTAQIPSMHSGAALRVSSVWGMRGPSTRRKIFDRAGIGLFGL